MFDVQQSSNAELAGYYTKQAINHEERTQLAWLGRKLGYSSFASCLFLLLILFAYLTPRAYLAYLHGIFDRHLVALLLPCLALRIIVYASSVSFD
ncbi:hypothetical protein BDP55DRAFT_356528 [Colletotrichum godetiae]|uniref:Uncharacterized protein n=1 Tax=Colletotrichum godetiae TaxID=1209918 RepID=A0AAJ0AD58_9PEZI|nr:uncharacterized protein BDP55DRAFT_356528 [Colletotrichum godetiae]KAK1659452.1 hypothetical protein BDP55DRAFT_356528 [Colletotrichum godetiae]